MKAIEVCHLRSFVLGVFQALQKDLIVHSHDVQAALDQCHESVMEIEITHFLQVSFSLIAEWSVALNYRLVDISIDLDIDR